MKFIYFLIVIILLQSCGKKSLNEKEILEIIHSYKGYENLELKKDFLIDEDFIDSIKTFRNIIAKENFKSIYEADFNNDGKLDYLVNLEYAKSEENDEIKILINEDDYHTAILLSNNKEYQLINPGKERIYDIISAKTISYKNQNLIKVVNFKKHIEDKNDLVKYDTLMVKNNRLTEFTNFSKNHHIEKIIFTQHGGYAPGIEYQLILKKDSLILQSNFYKNLEGNYITVNKANFKSISKYLNEINFISLSNHYSISCNDCSSIETEIIFDNGKSKKVYDYGEKGTLSLVKFYEMIDYLMKQEKWEKIN